MNKTLAQEMMERMKSIGEEMTQHPMGGGAAQDFPANYRGLAKVKKYNDDTAKSWLGIDMPFFVDVNSGETNIFTPAGQMASVADIARVCKIEVYEPHP